MADNANDSGLAENAYEVQVELSDMVDTDNPLAAANDFKALNLSEGIYQGLLAMNFKKPSKVQEKALPLLLADPPRNLIAQSQSGTGKTAAFVIAVLSRVDYSKPQQPQALILAPTRELARQIQGVVQSIGQFIPELIVEAAVPGAIDRAVGVKGSVVVGTPGTVMESIKRRQFDTRELRILVIDEADNMLDMAGLGDQANKVKNMLPRNIQILLFSATFPEKVGQYARKFAPNAHSMMLQRDNLTVKGISQMFMDCPNDNEKYDILVKLYSLMTIGSSVIFVSTRNSASIIEQRMVGDGHQVSALHGAFDPADRDRLLEDFRAGRSKVLITTNVMARGIDVSSVSMVINYDIPMKGPGESEPDPETYLHRIGRTGRFGRVGVSISFVSDKRSFNALAAIANEYNIDLVQLTPDDWDRTERKIQEVIKSTRAEPGYVPEEVKDQPQDEAEGAEKTVATE
ncbi:ATP-dependent RNA helicase DBP5 [Coniella lustricola]|uniref:RNA helicase n=1 Tax=Coniella lustricola TaxID=2025994 RepID=A0A2T2ZWY4_9PEZI|nr:ATP-dependent RNA helicase DBP5 [Coniella lustricola]